MRRALLSLVTALGLTLGSALPITAAVMVPLRIDCSDGDSLELTVDLDTLTSLTDSVQAINDSAPGLSCTLVQLSAPLTAVTFGSVAAAAQPTSRYVIGGGTIQAGCPSDTSQLFTASFAISCTSATAPSAARPTRASPTASASQVRARSSRSKHASRSSR